MNSYVSTEALVIFQLLLEVTFIQFCIHLYISIVQIEVGSFIQLS